MSGMFAVQNLKILPGTFQEDFAGHFSPTSLRKDIPAALGARNRHNNLEPRLEATLKFFSVSSKRESLKIPRSL